ncbi:MAG: hypothetical protein VYB65_08975 [Myxococcota bacterium]|nr:hypothetical protein [Myxococcota bacterium]
MSSLRGACLLACIACAESAAPNRAEAPAPASAEPVAPAGLKERLPPEGARYPQGIVNPLVGAFRRFDGFHLARTLWPNLSRFHAQIDQHDAAKGFIIGYLAHYAQGAAEGSSQGALDAVILFGERQDTRQRRLRVATFETIADPPGPLELIAASSDDGLRVSSEARLNLRRDGARLILDVVDGASRYSRSYQRLDKAWALEPGQPLETTK